MHLQHIVLLRNTRINTYGQLRSLEKYLISFAFTDQPEITQHFAWSKIWFVHIWYSSFWLQKFRLRTFILAQNFAIAEFNTAQ